MDDVWKRQHIVTIWILWTLKLLLRTCRYCN